MPTYLVNISVTIITCSVPHRSSIATKMSIPGIPARYRYLVEGDNPHWKKNFHVEPLKRSNKSTAIDTTKEGPLELVGMRGGRRWLYLTGTGKQNILQTDDDLN